MPPIMGGIKRPYESGQSGTARPESVVLTRPPTKIRKSVLAATATEKEWIHLRMGFVSLGGTHDERDETRHQRKRQRSEQRHAPGEAAYQIAVGAAKTDGASLGEGGE